MSLAVNSTGIFGRFTSLFKSKDPLKREIVQSAGIIERMIRNLEFSKRNLESILEEHKRKVKSNIEDQELKRILDDEMRNINGYLSIISKTLYDLARIKYRLETLMYVEEPLKVLPEIIEEVRTIEPVIEKINPELLNHVKTLEQKVAGILAISSSYIPGLTRLNETQEKQVQTQITETKTQVTSLVRPSSSKEIERPRQEQVRQSVTTSPKTGEISAVNPGKPIVQTREESAKIPEPIHQQQVQQTTREQSTALVSSNIPIHVVEQWIIEELRLNSGILDIRAFERKYGVSRELVMKALASLESKNLIRIKRKT